MKKTSRNFFSWLKRNEVSKRGFILTLAATLFVGGFFVYKFAFANDVFSVSITPNAVDIGQTKSIDFTVTSVNANNLKTIAVSVQGTGFSEPTSFVCLGGWSQIAAMPPILNGYVCNDPSGVGLHEATVTLNGLTAPNSSGIQNFSVSAINTNPTPQSANAPVQVMVKNLSATASVNLPTTDINQTRTYTFTITNNGGDSADSFTALAMDVPTAFTTISTVNTTTSGWTCSYDSGAKKINCSGSGIANGATLIITADATADGTAGPTNWNVNITGSLGGSRAVTSAPVITVQTLPNIEITPVISPAKVSQGQTGVIFTVPVKNTGDANVTLTSASSNITFSDGIVEHTYSALLSDSPIINGGGGTAILTFVAGNIDVAMVDKSYNPTLNLSGADSNEVTFTQSITPTDNPITAQTPAELSIEENISADVSAISKNSSIKTTTISLNVQNSGQADAVLTNEATALVLKDSSTNPITTQFSITPSSVGTISGINTKTITYQITAGASTVYEGPVTTEISLVYNDVNTGQASSPVADSKIDLFIVDSTVPNITDKTINPATAPTNNNTPTISFKVTDMGSNVNVPTVKVSNGTTEYVAICTTLPDCSVTLSPQTNGTYTFTISAADNAENIATSQVVTGYIIDTQAPTVNLTYDPGRPVKDADSVTITATFSENLSGTPKISIDTPIDDITNVDMTGSEKVWTYAWNVPTGDGSATIAITASDPAGNPNSPATNNTRVIDNTKPDSTINSPAASSWHNVDFVVNVSDTDSNGVAERYYRVYSDLNGDGDFTDGSEMTKDWTSRSEGDITITVGDGKYCQAQGLDRCKVQVKAIDNAGNENWSSGLYESSKFSIDWTAPDAATISIDSGAVVTKNATPTLTLTPGTVAPDFMRFSCNGTTWGDWVAWATSYDAFNVTSGVGCSANDGTKTVYISVKDAHGNIQAIVNSDTIIYDSDNKLTVGPSGKDFTTIQSAIDAATSNDTIKDTIEVFAGIYEEDVVINVDGLTLESVEPLGANIKGKVVIGGVGVSVSDVSVVGFKITDFTPLYGSTYAGIWLQGTSVTGISIEGNLIDGAAIWPANIQVSGIETVTGTSGNANIVDNVIQYVRRGIYANPGYSLVITDNTITAFKVIGTDNSPIVAHHNKLNVLPGGKGVEAFVVSVDAKNNWWGTYLENEITAKLSGDVKYDPWYMGEGMNVPSDTVGKATIYVDDSYTPAGENDGHYWGFNAFATIQEGVDAVVTDGVVNVAAGTHNGHVTINENLTLKGVQFGVDANGRTGSETLIEGTFGIVAPAADVTIDGFSFQAHDGFPNPLGLGSPYNSGIFGTVNKLTVKNNIFNKAPTMSGPYTNPGLVYVTSNNVTFTKNVVDQNINTASDPNAAYIVIGENGTAIIDDNTFTAALGIGAGAGSKISVTGNKVIDATKEGIWFWPVDATSVLTITGNTIIDFNAGNHADVAALKIVSKPASVNVKTKTLDMLAALKSDNVGMNTFELSWMTNIHNINKDIFYNTIQAAITAATAGDTINVAAGTYAENVTIGTAGVTLQAVTKHEAVAVIEGTVMITADGVTLDGFSIKNFSQIPTPDLSGVYIPSGTGITVKNNLIDGAGTVVPSGGYGPIGIQTLSGATAGATLEGNIVRNVKMGIYNQGAVLLISKNTIENTAHCAIGVDTSLGTTITRNTISNSASLGIEVFGANVVANFNSITGSANFGVWSNGPQVDAKKNWWGDISGPKHTSNPFASATSDSISDNVTYAPWCTEDTCNPTLIDETPPTAILAGTPSTLTNQASADITVSGDAQVLYYKYKLDSAPDYSSAIVVSTHITLSSLLDGSHTISVLGRDLAGNWQVTPTTYTWTIDAAKPIINPITSDATAIGWLKVGGKINFTLTLQNPEANSIVAGAYNDNNLTWTEQPDNKTFTATYTIAEGDIDQATALQITEVTVMDTANNTSDQAAGSDINKTIDANTPVISTITSVANPSVETTSGWLKVGDTITFTLTPATAEPGATVSGSYNGIVLNWSTANSGVTYTATYTVAEGNTDQLSALLQISGVTITDAAGNVSKAKDGTDVAKTIDAHTPALTLNSLFTDQTLTGGNNYPINWTASDLNLGSTPVQMLFSNDGGTTWTQINDIVSNNGAFTWAVPKINTSNAKIKVVVTDLAGNSFESASNVFTISYSEITDTIPPMVTLNSPNGGESWETGSMYVITWTANDNITAPGNLGIKLDYSLDGGNSWNPIADTDNDGAYSWTIPDGLNSVSALIKVTATDQALKSGSDISNTVFGIAAVPTPICTDAGSGQWNCSIALNPGWNLISLPVIPDSEDIVSVLGGLENLGLVQYYDAGTWKFYTPGVGGLLITMEDGKGYWVSMTGSAILNVSGKEMPEPPANSPVYSVHTEWNLIGFKQVKRMLSSNYLQSLIGQYILMDSTNTNKNSGYMETGQGYWLYTNQAGNIVTFK